MTLQYMYVWIHRHIHANQIVSDYSTMSICTSKCLHKSYVCMHELLS